MEADENGEGGGISTGGRGGGEEMLTTCGGPARGRGEKRTRRDEDENEMDEECGLAAVLLHRRGRQTSRDMQTAERRGQAEEETAACVRSG